MKIHLVYLTLWSVSQAAYISRMAVNRMRVPTAFRPGVTLHRPWTHRILPAASQRMPYVIYRNPPNRYAMKHFGPNANRNVFVSNGPWKTTARLPTLSAVTPEYEFIRAASAQPAVRVNGDTGAIHTIPAPNLSLSEKPIVVVDATEHGLKTHVTEAPKPTYEVTEKYVEPTYHVAKIESPIGFSKATSLTGPELQRLVTNGAALQFAADYGLSAISMPQTQIVPQQFTLQQGFTGMPTHQELLNSGAEGIIIPPNALYQPDPGFLHKIQNQLLQRFPAVEFIPYAADMPTEQQIQSQASQVQPQVVLLQQNEPITKQPPIPFVAKDAQKNVYQRETQENTIVTLVPQKFVVANVTEKQNEVTTPPLPQNITVELVTEAQPSTTTIKYIVESTTEEQKEKTTTPLYYAQVGQSVGSAIASGFFSAINDVRAAAALAQVQTEKPIEPTKPETENGTTTISPEFQPFFVHKKEEDKNETTGELKSVLGVPFTKPEESVKVAYTLYRAEDKEQKVTQDGKVYAGQIVEATISEDQDYNKQKNDIISRRSPIRLIAVTDTEAPVTSTTTTETPQKVAVVKAKIPPKSKLTFDDKTGEPVLRIYASYVDTPQQKEVLVSKLKHKELTRKQDTFDNWKAATTRTFDKTQGPNMNQVTNFGLKLRSRSDDYIPLFEDYEE
ncbi:uncharacterized protein isoform X1 [Choristoneura fumiferana]|uniref:uncharacterized protein isoform X1 n=1 Tax=Choristoneura fumiferana TaxID=7141 RepID=UPI003D15D541